MNNMNRRTFLNASIIGSLGALTANGFVSGQQTPPPKIQGFDQTVTDVDKTQVWEPVSDRKIRVGIAGFGACQFGAQFGFQNHPNVEVVAVTDLIPERRDGLAKACRCEKTYDSLEEMVKDDGF